jgi:hypothetical protein
MIFLEGKRGFYRAHSSLSWFSYSILRATHTHTYRIGVPLSWDIRATYNSWPSTFLAKNVFFFNLGSLWVATAMLCCCLCLHLHGASQCCRIMFQLCSTTSVPTLWSMGALSTWVCGTQQVLASSFASETRRSFLLQSTVNQYSYEFYRTGGLQQTAPIELPWCWCFSARLFSYQQSKLRECIKEGNNLALLTYLASPLRLMESYSL